LSKPKSWRSEDVTTTLVFSERYLEHNLGRGHPERPERLKAIMEELKRGKLWDSSVTPVIEPDSPAERADIELVHDPRYISLVEKLSERSAPIDGDTPTRENTYELALLSAGGAIKAGHLVASGKAENSFGFLRPPGHHASRARGGGFCYFNNIAILTECLKRDFGFKRIFILDWDAHHGNGTQDIFYEDPGVFYMSFHQHPLYPGTGFPSETGSGKGEGNTVNVQMAPGCGDAEYATAIEKVFIPICEQFRPQFIAVSAGFDAHVNDPLTGLRLSTQAYGWLTEAVMREAERLCGGKIVLLLEGGYDLDALGGGAYNVVQALRGKRFKFPKPARLETVEELKGILAEKWDLR
jgi:acetoin utilization deacetylase AcuC-like enzyme